MLNGIREVDSRSTRLQPKRRGPFTRLLLLLALLPALLPATAQDVFTIDSLRYRVISASDRTVGLEKCEATAKAHIDVPKRVTYLGKTYTVTEIQYGAFFNNLKLTSVTLPNSIITIDEAAFAGCENLKDVNIPESVITIGVRAFRFCGLTSINIPNSVKSIESQAFQGCDLREVNIPASVMSIKSTAFMANANLKSINVDAGNKAYTSMNGIMFTKDKKVLCIYPAGKEEASYTIPYTVTRIGSYSFLYVENLKSVEIPNSVTWIGREAFSSTGLTSVVIPNSVDTVGNDAFRFTPLTSVVLPDSVIAIGGYAFSSTKLKSFKIPETVKLFGNYMFAYCDQLESVSIPPTLKEIGYGTFELCNALRSIECMAENPYTFFGATEETVPFPDAVYENATLYVPIGRAEAYKGAEIWKKFRHIQEKNFGGVGGIETDETVISSDGRTLRIANLPAGACVRVYNLAGKQVYQGSESEISGLERGIYLVRIGDKTHKILH